MNHRQFAVALIVAVCLCLACGRGEKTERMTEKRADTAIVQHEAGSTCFCRIRDFTSYSGLLQTHISNAVQDRKGFIWFATWNGLIRFDGTTFNTFKPVMCSEGKISSNRIYNVKRSSDDNALWCVSSENRLFRFNMTTCTFTDVLAGMEQIGDKRVKFLTPMPKGATWVVFKDQSCLRLEDKDCLNSYRYYPRGHQALMGAARIVGVNQDDNGNEWILTDAGAICMTRGIKVKGTFNFVNSIGAQVYLIGQNGEMAMVESDGYVSHCTGAPNVVNHVITSDGLLLMAADDGVWAYDADKRSFTQYGTRQSIYLYQDARKRIWALGHDNSVTLLSLSTGSVTVLRTEPSDLPSVMRNPQLVMEDAAGTVILKPEQGLLSYYDEKEDMLKPCRFYKGEVAADCELSEISKFFTDHQHNLWILQPHAAQCITFCSTSFQHWNCPARQECRAIYRDSKGGEWIADRSLAVCQKGRGYLSPDGRWQSAPVPFTRQPAYCIREDAEHRIWMGTKGDGLYLLTPAADGNFGVEHFVHDARNATSLRSDSIYDILQTSDGTVLLGSYGHGLSSAMEDKNGNWEFQQVKDFPANTKVRCISEISPHIFLIGTTNGIITADLRKSASPKYYQNTFRNEDWGLKGNDIMRIIKHDGSWYVCVFGSGISKIVSSSLTNDTIHFENHMMPSVATADQIKSAVSDGHCIWLFSEQSIVRFNPATGGINIFDKTNFIGDFNFAEGQPIINGNRIVVGISDGVLTFQTDAVNYNRHQPHIVLTGIQYQNDMAIHPLNDIQQLEINPEQRSFSLYLSALDYDGQEAVRYRYRMEGYDKGWNYTSESQQSVNYSSLSPGNYVLIVQATNSEGEWDENVRRIDVNVIPRFVETIWFKLIILLLVVAVFLGMAYAIVYLSRMRRLLQRKYSFMMTVDEFSRDISIDKELKESAEEEQHFLRKSIAFFEENIGSRNFLVEDMARHIGMSRTAYYKKMKSITGLSPIDFIKQLRIKKALKLMDNSSLPIAEIAYKVGFSDPKYFSKCFKAEMGMTPTQYMNDKSVT